MLWVVFIFCDLFFTVLDLSGEVALDQSLAKVEEVDEGAKDEEGEDQNNQEEGKKYFRKTHTPSHLEMTTTNEQKEMPEPALFLEKLTRC